MKLHGLIWIVKVVLFIVLTVRNEHEVTKSWKPLRFVMRVCSKNYISRQWQHYAMQTLVPGAKFQNKSFIRSSPLWEDGKPDTQSLFWNGGHSSASRRCLTEQRSACPVPAVGAAMRLRVAGAVLLSATAYYVYLPLPSGVSEPWKLMLLDALFRSFLRVVRAADAPPGTGWCEGGHGEPEPVREVAVRAVDRMWYYS